METNNSTILDLQEQTTDTTKNVDYKMVTFSLAGKEYGIDIMKVKEISKAERFTYVPNTAPYVRGVHNLRGDIISIIDLRIMFHLPAAKKKEGDLEDLIILRLDTFFIGVIVDSIDKVVGISAKSIQPPHPLFGDINIKFIRGIVENDNKLYIILDVERILGVSGNYRVRDEEPKEEIKSGAVSKEIDQNVDLGFIVETLKTFSRFIVSDMNIDWVKSRFDQWKQERGKDIEKCQLKDVQDAESFLEPFYSPCSMSLWNEDYMQDVIKAFPEIQGSVVSIWNPGCGKGYETYSLAIAVRKKYPSAAIKIWANDSDLLSISTAPNLVFQKDDIPEFIGEYFLESRNALQPVPVVRDVILFEFHDILNPNPFPDVDIILARDVLSFLQPADQLSLLKEFYEKLKPHGVLVIGKNEKVTADEWIGTEYGNIIAYKKKNV